MTCLAGAFSVWFLFHSIAGNSFSTGIVKPPSMRLSSTDRNFVLNVINGMGGRDEHWVRQQFSNYTKYVKN